MSPLNDEAVGITDLEASVDRARHARADLAECLAIVDELFPGPPLTVRVPPTGIDQQRRWKSAEASDGA